MRWLDDEPEAEEDAQVDPEQTSMFGDEYSGWHSEWRGMPDFVQQDLSPFKTVIVHFANSRDLAEFAKLTGQSVTARTRSIWYPEAKIGRMADKRYTDEP